MKSLWIAVALLIFSVLAGCQAVAAGLSNSGGSDNTSGSDSLALNVTQPANESIVRTSPVTVTGNIRPDADVTINGLSINVENGHFSARVVLEPGSNVIDVSAADSSGKQASRYLTVVYVP
jgi:hypothetical protein